MNLTPRDIFRALKLRRGGALLLAILTLALTAGVFFLVPRSYTATATIYVNAAAGSNANTAFEATQLAQQRVSTYIQLIDSPSVTSGVVRDLQLPTTVAEVAGRLTASSSPDSVLINISAVDGDPERAAAVANAASSQLQQLIQTLERPVVSDGAATISTSQVQRAIEPTAPSFPALPLFAGVGLLAAVALAVAYAVARETFDQSIRTTDQLDALAKVPALAETPFTKSLQEGGGSATTILQGLGQGSAYSQLSSRIRSTTFSSSTPVLLLTSSLPEEGKSTTAVSLAATMAAVDGPTLLIDADLRRPSLDKIFGVERAVGLTSVLSGAADAIRATQPVAQRLDLLASGNLPPNPSELLSSITMRRVLDKLRAHYRYIVVDSPPLLPVTDAAALAPASDGVIMICRYKSTKDAEIARAVTALEAVSAPLLGTVLSASPTTRQPFGRAGLARGTRRAEMIS
jgi:succinoglycan biosynthesis transport protein ExoP